jgi:hypothetical protein
MEGLSQYALPNFGEAHGWKVPVTYCYQPGDQITMRVFLYGRFRPEQLPDPQCQVFRLVVLRVRYAGMVEQYGPQEQFLTLQVPMPLTLEETAEDGVHWIKIFMPIDLPLNSPDGLNLTNDLEPGQMLAFGMQWASPGCPDDGVNYTIGGAEFFCSPMGEVGLSGATISLDPPDCQDCGSGGDE